MTQGIVPDPAELGAVLAVLQESATFVAAGRTTPSRVRLEVLGAVVEVSWTDGPTEPAPGPVSLLAPYPLPVTTNGAHPTNGTGPAAIAASTPPRSAATAEHAISSPMVGVFYVGPEPGAPPFVQVGDVVTVGQQVGIVEAMKLLIPVEAERGGRVVSVLVGDGDPVEYGQPLIIVDLG